MQPVIRFALAAAFWLLALAAQLSGFTNTYVAAALATAGVLLLLGPGTHYGLRWLRARAVKDTDAAFTPMPEAARRVYETLRGRKGPSLESVERRAREECSRSIPVACANGMGRHLTIYGEPRPSTVREPLSEEAWAALGFGALRFSDDASKLVDGESREVWANLTVREAELSAHLTAIQSE